MRILKVSAVLSILNFDKIDLCGIASQEDVSGVVDGPEPQETLVRVARKISNTGHVTVEVLTAVPAADICPVILPLSTSERESEEYNILTSLPVKQTVPSPDGRQ